MAKIDIREWKEFKLTDLFTISGSVTTPKNDLDLDSYQTEDKPYPYITTAATYNGVCGYSSKFTEKGNVITIDSAVVGTAFYQKDNFTASDHVEKLTPKFEMTENIGKFFAAILNANARKIGYIYANKRSQTALKSETIKLPITSENLPDYAYMEEYMRRLEDSVSSSLTALQSAQELEKKKIDVSDWKEFNMADLGFTNHHGSRIKKADRIDGNTIFLTAGKENCGVVGTIGNKIAIWHNPITIDMFGNTFYHDYDCAGDDNIYALVNDNLTQHVKMFLAAVIAAKNSNQYSYEDQFRQDNVDNLSILLPVTADNKPDWNYMEKYVQSVLSMTTKQISSLPI